MRGPGNRLFLPHDAEMVNCLTPVSDWANGQGDRYRADAISQFLSCADYYLVAYALAYKCTIVTLETTDRTIKRIKTPDACAGLGVTCISTFVMLRTEGARFLRQLAPDELNTDSEFPGPPDDVY